MSFLKSLLFGSEGSYTIFGTNVEFQNDPSYLYYNLDEAHIVSQLASKCVSSNTFRWMTQGYAHIFMHEMSHALAYKLLADQDATVRIFKSSCTAQTEYPSLKDFTSWKTTIRCVAGPMGNMAFSTCKLIAATALKNYLSWPIALALGSGAVIWMSGELLYAYVSATNKDRGDFGKIANCGNTHLALASTALVGQAALGIFAAIKLAA